MTTTVTTDEAAALAGVQPGTIRQWVHRGWLTPTTPPGTRPHRYNYDDVTRAQADHRPPTWRRRHADTAQRWHTTDPTPTRV